MLATIADNFAEHGAEALAKLRTDDPLSYPKIVASFVPRELILQREREPDFADLTLEEIAELADRARRNRVVKAAIDFEEKRP